MEEEGFDAGSRRVDDLLEVREELAALHTRLQEPDSQKAVETMAATSRAMQSTFEISKEFEKLDHQARQQREANQTLMNQAREYSESADRERKQTDALIKANQKIVNNAFNSYSGEIKNLRKKITEADYEIRMLCQAASENSALIKKAGKIVSAWEANK